MDFENPEDLAEIIKDPRSFNSFGFGDFNLGLAKGVIEGGAGIPQMIAQFGEKLGISGQREFLDKLESEVKVAKDAIDSATSDSPIVAGTGDVVGQSIPALAIPAAKIAKPLQAMAQGTAVGAAAGASQFEDEDENRLITSAAGGALGGVFGRIFGKTARS